MVKFIGRINREQVNELYGSARAGICIYQPAANHFEAQPIKMFEFMAAGLPVVASDFPLWKEIIENAQCGICVNPQDSNAVKEACEALIFNPENAEAMGRTGRSAVEETYNWNIEEAKLLALYEIVGGKNADM